MMMTKTTRMIAGALAALLLAAGIFGWWRYIDLHSGGASGNHAIVDEKATSEVQAVVAQTFERILTYDYADPQTTQAAAASLLSGEASKDYETLFAKLQEKAPDQKLVLTASVAAAGVVELDDTKAELLVFVDQSSRKAGDENASVSAAQLSVTAERKDGKWTVTGLKPL